MHLKLQHTLHKTITHTLQHTLQHDVAVRILFVYMYHIYRGKTCQHCKERLENLAKNVHLLSPAYTKTQPRHEPHTHADARTHPHACTLIHIHSVTHIPCLHEYAYQNMSFTSCIQGCITCHGHVLFPGANHEYISSITHICGH